jgi:phosphopantothenate-cysteine ligase
MAVHKIQSDSGLDLQLSQVPKALGTLTSRWAPGCYVVSFKLETDPQMVVKKAKRAIHNYKVRLVVANQLQVRKASD